MPKILTFIPAILAAVTFGSSQDIPFDQIRPGHATYYSWADGTGNCMLEALPEPQYVGALNNIDYNTPVINGKSYANATLCGAYAKVSGQKGSVVIKIVDRCPDAICTKGHIDLSPEAFAEIDDIGKGYIDISWQLVSVPMNGPIRFRYKDGSSQWWTGIQIRNHRNPVARVELYKNSSWQILPRAQYNYFIAADGFGPGCHTLRVTDVFGNKIVEQTSICLNDKIVTALDWVGKEQFPPP